MTEDRQPNKPEDSIWSLLAGLRFLFSMWVLFAHTYNFGTHERGMPVPSLSGLIAVVCFFAISGFSIHHSIASQPSGYYKRRFWRIFPISITAVAWALLNYLVFGQIFDGHGREYPLPGAELWIEYLLLIHVFFWPSYIDVLFPLWSLSIELVFYMLAPLVRRIGKSSLLAIIGLSSLVFLIWPYLGMGDIAFAPYGSQVLAFAWVWLAGWLAYVMPRSWVAALVTAAVGAIFITTQPASFWLVNAVSIGSTYLVWFATVAVLFNRPPLVLRTATKQTLNYLGNLSFTLYLIHYPVLFGLTSSVFRARPEWNHGLTQTAVSLLAAVIVYHLIDKPLRRFGGARSATILQRERSGQVSACENSR